MEQAIPQIISQSKFRFEYSNYIMVYQLHNYDLIDEGISSTFNN